MNHREQSIWNLMKAFLSHFQIAVLHHKWTDVLHIVLKVDPLEFKVFINYLNWLKDKKILS